MIANVINDEIGSDINRRQVESQPIRMIGIHKIVIHLTIDLTPEVTIVVHREGESPAAMLEAEAVEEEGAAEAEAESVEKEGAAEAESVEEEGAAEAESVKEEGVAEAESVEAEETVRAEEPEDISVIDEEPVEVSPESAVMADDTGGTTAIEVGPETETEAE